MPDDDSDFHGWANEQAALLRAGRLDDADVAEALDSLGRSEGRRPMDRLVASGQDHVRDYPGLALSLSGAIDSAYRTALVVVRRETRLDHASLPWVCCWARPEVMAEAVHPR